MNKLLYIGSPKPEYYNNILIKASPGLHKKVANLITQKLPMGASILDLGAGEGAMTNRLIDLGYKLTAVDMNQHDFKLDKSLFLQINFNRIEEIKKLTNDYFEYFDAVIGIEVIEHVENPWEYVRLLKKLIKPNGYVLLTTPNISSWYSRLHFLFTGKFWGFDENALEYGHINPINAFEIHVIFSKEKFKNITFTNGGFLPEIWITRNLLYSMYSFLAILFRPFMQGISRGWCIIVTAQK